jgi:tRNA G18 (ribose-2'-O)-methylase SpoU
VGIPTATKSRPERGFVFLAILLWPCDKPGRARQTARVVPDPMKVLWSEERRAERRLRRRDVYRRGLRPFAVAAWNITKEHNVGSLVRTAHATAATEVVLVGDRDWNVEAARTSELYTTIIHLPDGEAFRDHLAERRWQLVAVELHHRAVSVFEAEYPDRPCFLVGAELGGVPDELVTGAAAVVQIPQWGLVPSLNLAVAGSLVIYDYLAKLHRKGILDRPAGGMVDVEG